MKFRLYSFRSCWHACCVASEDMWHGRVQTHCASTVAVLVTPFATAIDGARGTRFADDVECAAIFRRLALFALYLSM